MRALPIAVLAFATACTGAPVDDGADETGPVAIVDGKADGTSLPAPADTAGYLYFDDGLDLQLDGTTPDYRVFGARGGTDFTIEVTTINDDGDLDTSGGPGWKLYRLAKKKSGYYWKLVDQADGPGGDAVASYYSRYARTYLLETATAQGARTTIHLSCGDGTSHTACALAGQPRDACKKSGACDEGLFCQPMSCGSSAGACAPAPTSCPKLGLACQPVCGCDGNTYCAGCDVQLARVAIAHPGTCGCDVSQWTTGPDGAPPSGSFVDPQTSDEDDYSITGKGRISSVHTPGCVHATPYHCNIASQKKDGGYIYTSPTVVQITYDDGTSATFHSETNCAQQQRWVGQDWGTTVVLGP